jgi:hypothetical protein
MPEPEPKPKPDPKPKPEPKPKPKPKPNPEPNPKPEPNPGGGSSGKGVTSNGFPKAADLPPLPSTATPPAGAIVVKTMRDFKFTESMVFPPKAGPDIQNIQQVAPGIIAFYLRDRGSWHDGDRSETTGKQATKSRAEIYDIGGLNKPYKVGETWLIGGTVFVPNDYVHPDGYHDIAQPMLHSNYLLIDKPKGNNKDLTASMMTFTRGLGSDSKLVRKFPLKRGGWTTWVLRAVVAQKGRLEISVNGDAFQGTDVDLSIGHIRKATIGKVDRHGGTFGSYFPAGGKHDTLIIYANMFIKKI